jgi:hypothetical protein
MGETLRRACGGGDADVGWSTDPGLVIVTIVEVAPVDSIVRPLGPGRP